MDHVGVHLFYLTSNDSGCSATSIFFATWVSLSKLESTWVFFPENGSSATLVLFEVCTVFMELRTKIQGMTIETQLRRRRTRRLQSVCDQFVLYVFSIKHTGCVTWFIRAVSLFCIYSVKTLYAYLSCLRLHWLLTRNIHLLYVFRNCRYKISKWSRTKTPTLYTTFHIVEII